MGVDFGGLAVGIGLLNYNEIHENTGCTSTMPHQLPKCTFLGGIPPLHGHAWPFGWMSSSLYASSQLDITYGHPRNMLV